MLRSADLGSMGNRKLHVRSIKVLVQTCAPLLAPVVRTANENGRPFRVCFAVLHGTDGAGDLDLG